MTEWMSKGRFVGLGDRCVRGAAAAAAAGMHRLQSLRPLKDSKKRGDLSAGSIEKCAQPLPPTPRTATEPQRSPSSRPAGFLLWMGRGSAVPRAPPRTPRRWRIAPPDLGPASGRSRSLHAPGFGPAAEVVEAVP